MYVYLILDIYLMPIPDKDITREIKKLLQTSISYEHSCKILQKDSYKQNPAAYKNYTLWPSRIYLFAKNARLVHRIRVHEYNQFSCSSCPTLCDPIDWSMPGFPVRHQLPELAQTRVHQVGDAIQPSCPLLSPSPPAFSLSQHRGLFQWVSSLHQVADALELQLQHQSFQWIFRTDFFRIDWFDLLAVQGTLKSLQQSQFKIFSSSALNFLYGPTLTSIHEYWICVHVIYINKRKHKITWSSPMHLCPTYVKRGKSIQWRKDGLFNKSGWENWTATCKRM